MAETESLKAKLTRRVSALDQERNSFIQHWQELAEYTRPRRGRFLTSDRNRGEKRYNKIINGRATWAHKVATAGMLSGVMSPTRPWFSLETPDKDMMEYQPVKIWLAQVEQILFAVFNDSNLYNMAPQMLGELLLFGTGCMTHVDDYENVARFYTHTAGSYMIAQDGDLKVNTLAREFEWTVEQIVSRFGIENVSRGVKEAYDKGNYDSWFPVTHIIQPNEGYYGKSGASKNKRFKSCYFEPGGEGEDGSKLLSEKGFDEFPAYVPRWETTDGDIYGTDCPGMTSLGDVKTLQMLEKRKAQAIDKLVNPPLTGPASLRNVPINSLPGGLTLGDVQPGSDGLKPIYQVNPQIQHMTMDIQAKEGTIDRAYYVDMFLAISNMDGIQPRNEFELSQRNQERLLQLGPVLEQMHGTWLSPMINRTFNQAVRAGIFPPAPPELQGKQLKIRYISTLAMAQRAVATQGIDRLAAFVGGLVEAGWAGAADKFDSDQAVDEYAAVTGAPPKIVVPDDVVAERRAERAKQEQAANMAAMGESVSKSAANVGGIDMSKPNGITAIMNQMGGGRR